MGCWCGYLSAARCRLFAYGPADALHPKNPSPLASFKSRLILPFWYWLIRAVLEKRPLNGRSVVIIYVYLRICNAILHSLALRQPLKRCDADYLNNKANTLNYRPTTAVDTLFQHFEKSMPICRPDDRAGPDQTKQCCMKLCPWVVTVQ